MTAPKGPPAPRRWWRNPFLWAALLGMATVTALRPVLRRVPEPLPVAGRLPDTVSLLGVDDGMPMSRDWFTGHATVLAFVQASCAECGRLWDGARDVARVLRAADVGVPVVVVGLGDEAGALRARAADAGARGEVLLATAHGPGGCELVRACYEPFLGAGAVSCDRLGEAVRASRLALVDGEGGVRGLFETSPAGLDEAMHRARDLGLAEAAARRSRRAGPD